MRVLIVEDEFLAAILLEEELRLAGCDTVGPFYTLAQARSAAKTERFDLVVLDINLNGEMVYPLARDLLARGIPFIFLSGYATRDLPKEFQDHPRLSKPFDPILLRQRIERAAGVRRA
jgi:DNA-binding response OmpR family regulator